ncbi:MAG: HAD hydrolase-like protein [Lachnospiraceae bacterium]|nr:HAD hydrolase-like protein [Lachnospiraceae bacterium]
MKRYYEYILFDLDGTLTESAPGIINAVIYALKKNGIEETDREKLLSFVGPPLVDSYQKYYGISAEQAIHMVDDYREYYHVSGWKENSVYTGIPEVLQTLRNQGRKLVVATSKPEMSAKQILSYFGLDSYFELIAGASMDESRSQKGRVIAYALSQLKLELKAPSGGGSAMEASPQGFMPGILMVGDRSHDVNGARENGLPCVGVLYGYGNQRELEEAGAAAICPEVSDLPRVIEALERGE